MIPARTLSPLMTSSLAFMLGACGPDATDIRVRAAFDLKCPKNQLEVIKLGEKTRGVRGCGNQATYVYTNGEWFLNTDPKSLPPAEPTGAPTPLMATPTAAPAPPPVGH